MRMKGAFLVLLLFISTGCLHSQSTLLPELLESYGFVTSADSTPPVISLLTPTNGSIVQPFSWINLSITDDTNVSLVLYHWDLIANETLDQPYALKARTSEVGHYLYVYANDTSDNWAGALFYFISDGAAPEIVLDTPSPGHIDGSGTEVNVTTTDLHLQTVLYNWDHNPNATGSPLLSTEFPVGDGVHTLYIYANDSASNWGTAEFSFVTDDLAPVVSCSPTNNSVLSTGANVSIHVDDASFEAMVHAWDTDSPVVVSTPSTEVLTPSGEGIHVLHVWANDTFGRNTSLDFAFEIDDTAPTLDLSSWSNGTLLTPEDTGTVVANDTHLDQVFYSWDGQNNVTYVYSLVVPADDGMHTLRLFANDTAGNTAVRGYYFEIDASSPSIQDPGDLVSVMNDTETTIEWTGHDANPGTYRVLLNGSEIASGAWTEGVPIVLAIHPTSTGTLNYTLILTDLVNHTTVDTVIVVVTQQTSHDENSLSAITFVLVLLGAGSLVSGIVVIVLWKKRELFKPTGGKPTID